MSWTEISPVAPRLASTAGTLTLECRELGRGTELRLVAYPAVLRGLTWYRGGAGVSVVHGSRQNAGLLRIVREGPHLLLAQGGTLEKLPPVFLRIAPFSWMNGELHAAVEVTYQVGMSHLELLLPAWARPPGMVPPPFANVMMPATVRRVVTEGAVSAGGGL